MFENMNFCNRLKAFTIEMISKPNPKILKKK